MGVDLGLGPDMYWDCPSPNQSPNQSPNPTVYPSPSPGLIHAPEVHRELKLTQGQVDQLENLFDQIDGQWWRSRNLKPDENAAVILKLEETVDDWFRSNGTAVQQHRLQQLVLWSQGTRMLLRKDVKQKLGLSKGQSQSILDLAQSTQNAQLELQQATRQNLSTDDLRDVFSKAQQAEQQVFTSVLKPEQIAKLRELVGQEFDTKG